MIVSHYFEHETLKTTTEIEILDKLNAWDFLWVDLIHASYEERKKVEEKFDTELFTRQEAEEIESSSRYFESETEINANSNFLIRTNHGYHNEPVSFILKSNLIITQRNVNLKSFDDMHRKVEMSKKGAISNFIIFITIFEVRIDFDADFLENIAREISDISRQLAIDRDLDEKMLIRINSYQEITMLIRENIVDKQRIISSILKSRVFPKEEFDDVKIMMNDVSSLLEHTSFNFDRLEYLQNTFLGLIDIEQNKIIKIFTVVTVIFLPPTLIASMYGMNFRFMPELDQLWGYPFAILLMLISSGLTLMFFKKKNWL